MQKLSLKRENCWWSDSSLQRRPSKLDAQSSHPSIARPPPKSYKDRKLSISIKEHKITKRRLASLWCDSVNLDDGSNYLAWLRCQAIMLSTSLTLKLTSCYWAAKLTRIVRGAQAAFAEKHGLLTQVHKLKAGKKHSISPSFCICLLL
jgi:hypothetical protein